MTVFHDGFALFMAFGVLVALSEVVRPRASLFESTPVENPEPYEDFVDRRNPYACSGEPSDYLERK